MIWKKYDAAFSDLALTLPTKPAAGTVHARHLYTPLLRLEELNTDRDGIMQALLRENIGTGIHFISLHLHEYYQKRYHYKKIDYPNAAFISDRTISLPLSAKLSDQDVADVIAAVRKVLMYYRRKRG